MVITRSVYANYIGPSVMTDANSEKFPICDERITENDRCVIKIIGIHCKICIWMICRHKLYHFTVANTRFTALLTCCSKTKFATVK